MKWKRFVLRLKTSLFWTAVVAMEQTAVNIFIPGVYRREWKDTESGNVEILTIRLRDNVADIYELTLTRSRLIPHRERVVYNSQPQVFMAAYNAGSKQLFEIGGERIFSFLMAENVLLAGKVAFVKVSGEVF